MSLLLSSRRTRMVQRQNTKFYGPRKIWQVSKGFGNIVCISENLKKKLESTVTRSNFLYIHLYVHIIVYGPKNTFPQISNTDNGSLRYISSPGGWFQTHLAACLLN